jgi:ubiquitin C-terminal hydrolase
MTVRSVARPVSNLGNTCYMNAVLQALAHAPELCLAMDCQPHHVTCPLAAEAKLRSSSPNSLEDPISIEGESRRSSHPSRKSSRRGNGRKSPPGEGDSASAASSNGDPPFCALCEMEHYLRQVHDTAAFGDKPFAPRTFVDGFIDHVAPWFQLGVQEDSHEFLRLLIDAMQQSCHRARPLQDEAVNPQEDREGSGEDENGTSFDQEYPFSLFRGTVQSDVVCEFCQATSSTLDPIEDVGLEVTVPQPHPIVPPPAQMGYHRSNSSTSSRTTSPVPHATALTDVQTAFQRFSQTEPLDSSYKCEQCGKVGRATKQSRLASIPPILTLHLKRFRYGDCAGGPSVTATSRRSRSEVSQLLGHNEYSTGKSGSSKIEGHIKFAMCFDLKPYLTDELKAQHDNMFCRLFAVIVHAGKNSHSGHYIAFCRNVSKNEWWKMDDSRVSAVTEEEVMQAEAYMLFYRVVKHPIAVQLEELYKRKVETEERLLATGNSEEVLIEVKTNFAAQLPSRKRPLECYENGEEWARHVEFPPHLMGLVHKMTHLIADDLHISGEYYRKISEEAAQGSARCKLTGKLVMSNASTTRRRSIRILSRRQGLLW